MAKSVELLIQSFDRDEDGFNENEETFEKELTAENISQVLFEAGVWVKERQYKDGDLSGMACVLEDGAQTDDYVSFNSAETFEEAINQIKLLV